MQESFLGNKGKGTQLFAIQVTKTWISWLISFVELRYYSLQVESCIRIKVELEGLQEINYATLMNQWKERVPTSL